MIALLGRIVGEGPLPQELQTRALEMFATILQSPAAAPDAAGAVAAAPPVGLAAAAVGGRRLVYVHGICRHVSGFSDPWWAALHPFVPAAFGQGVLGQTRLEVIWSAVVNQASAMA